MAKSWQTRARIEEKVVQSWVWAARTRSILREAPELRDVRQDREQCGWRQRRVERKVSLLVPRIVAVADTHLYHDELVVPDGDVFVHAGDLCRRGTLEELRRAIEVIRALPHPHKLLVAGNHDWSFVREPLEARALLGSEIHYLEDSELTLVGLRFWGSPWQPEFNQWAFNLPRGRPLAEKWSLIPEGLDVLVTHGPPAGFGDRVSTAGRQGCADLLARVRAVRPRVHLFGHIHDDGGSWTSEGVAFANVTTSECERAPTVIDIEGETIRVQAPPARRLPRG